VRADARSASTTGISEPDLKVCRWKLVCRLLRPFHEANGVAVEDVPEPGVHPLLRSFEAIKIKVMQV
jgi:hypothetical protein